MTTSSATEARASGDDGPDGGPGYASRLLAWSRRAAPPKHAYAIAALIGLIVNLLVFGAGHVLGTSSYWDLPQEDSRAYLMGYRYFLHEPWHWPPFVVHEMNVPYTKNIVFTDSIPLWAGVNKAIATVIPPWGPFSERAYLGMWHLLVYMLQASFGVANLRALGKRSYAHAILTALFILAIPAFDLRYGHASLSAHFLMLWALSLYLRTPARAPANTKRQLGFLAQLAVAAMINPYQVAMSFVFYVAALVRTRHRRSLLIWLPLGLVAIALAAGLAGFFAREAKVPMGGFDVASANLLSPFIPRRSVLFGDCRWVADVEAVIYQYEGYDYLGLGLLTLLALFIPRARMLGAVIKRHPLLFAAAVGVSIFSLSNHIYWGSHRIISFEWPAKLHWVTEQYRSPGRFIWLPTYIFIVFILHWAFDSFDRGWRLLILPVLTVAQIIDGGLGDWLYVRGYTRKEFPHYLDIEHWQPLVHAHGAVEVHPPYDCILDGTMFIDHVSQEIEFLASQRTLPINGVYSARPTRNCKAEEGFRRTLKPDERTLYVLLPRVAHLASRLEALGATCGSFRVAPGEPQNGRVCSMRPAAIEAGKRDGILGPSLPPPTLRFGQKLALGEGTNEAFIQDGWSWPEPTGRWSAEETASIVFRLEGAEEAAATKTNPMMMTLNLEASVVLCGAREEADIDVILGGVHVATMHFTKDTNDARIPRSIPIPSTNVSTLERSALLELRARDTRSPRALGCNDDDRKLGVWVQSLWFGQDHE